MTSVRLPEDIESRLNALAIETHRTKSFYIIEAIKMHLEDLEDLYVATRRIARKNRKFHTSEEMLQILEKQSHV